MSAFAFAPGSLVSARGREWVVLGGSTAETLRVRPATGSDPARTLIHLSLEIDPVREARFPPPDADQLGGHEAALLLRDALLLSLRRGAGPFRSFGQIAVEPRAYQLVPLLMALKLDPVRPLIADDVGVGKTIEALLIARELLDRGDIERSVVLCPPHLVAELGCASTSAPLWDPERRFRLRCEIDAAFFHLYGISRDDAGYILETFPVVAKSEEREHGEYRTKRVVLETWDALASAAAGGTPYESPLGPPRRAEWSTRA